MSWNDTDYFRKRASVERALAAAASNPAAAAAHDELAHRYEALVSDAKRPTLHIVTDRAA
jgi:hypothetical protein